MMQAHKYPCKIGMMCALHQDRLHACRDTEADPFPVQPLDVIITAEDQMLPIGSVSSILGKMIVIQVLKILLHSSCCLATLSYT